MPILDSLEQFNNRIYKNSQVIIAYHFRKYMKAQALKKKLAEEKKALAKKKGMNKYATKAYGKSNKRLGMTPNNARMGTKAF